MTVQVRRLDKKLPSRTILIAAGLRQDGRIGETGGFEGESGAGDAAGCQLIILPSLGYEGARSRGPFTDESKQITDPFYSRKKSRLRVGGVSSLLRTVGARIIERPHSANLASSTRL